MRSKISYNFKALISKVVLFFLYRAIKVLTKNDSRVKDEFYSWPNGLTVALKASLNGPSLYAIKSGNTLKRVKHLEQCDVDITFKSLDAAFLVLTGQMGVSQAYAEHRFMLSGDIGITMSLVRTIEITEAYLFPGIMLKRILKDKIKKEKCSLTIYRKVLFGV